MSKNNRLIQAIAIGLAAVLLAGCAISAPAAGTTDTAPAEVVEEAVAAAEEIVPETEAPVVDESTDQEKEITEIKVMLVDLLGKRGGADDVIARMNEITEEAIGVRASVQWSSLTEYPTAASLAIASGEDVDIIWISPLVPMDFTTLFANGQLMDITDYIEEEGKDLLDMMGDYIAADMNNGRIYGIPTFRNYASSRYLIMRIDILEELGLMEKAENLKTWTEVEEIFEAVKENKTIAPLGTSSFWAGNIFGSDIIAERIPYDDLGDAYNVIFSDYEGNISFLPENEEFRKNMDRMREWWDAGYVYKDLLTTDEHQDTLLRDGVIFSTIDGSEMGVEVAKKESTGHDVLCFELCSNLLGSGPMQNIGLAVPVTSSEPDAAVRWINELYKTPELCNLITWGIEGEHYVVEDGVAKYPEGLSSDSGSYHMPDYMFGNYFNDLPWDGSDPDFRQQARNKLDEAALSPYMGFVVDMSKLDDVVVAINSCYQRYDKQIRYGAFSDEDYDAYVAALKAADADAYMQEFQNQITAWMQNN